MIAIPNVHGVWTAFKYLFYETHVVSRHMCQSITVFVHWNVGSMDNNPWMITSEHDSGSDTWLVGAGFWLTEPLLPLCWVVFCKQEFNMAEYPDTTLPQLFTFYGNSFFHDTTQQFKSNTKNTLIKRKINEFSCEHYSISLKIQWSFLLRNKTDLGVCCCRVESLVSTGTWNPVIPDVTNTIKVIMFFFSWLY